MSCLRVWQKQGKHERGEEIQHDASDMMPVRRAHHMKNMKDVKKIQQYAWDVTPYVGG